jgi:hypothetical protein
MILEKELTTPKIQKTADILDIKKILIMLLSILIL